MGKRKAARTTAVVMAPAVCAHCGDRADTFSAKRKKWECEDCATELDTGPAKITGSCAPDLVDHHVRGSSNPELENAVRAYEDRYDDQEIA
jgi:ribosomal protein L37AE/L43A